MSKKYGLILPDKAKSQPLTFQASRNVFGNDSDSDDNSKKRPKLPWLKDKMNRKTKITQDKAVTEDPTVYQYDEIYDEMASKKEGKKLLTKEDKRPKYIENLMKSANKRKIENERRIERQIQKERENEGDEFKDKEVFVTSAYKKKIEEMRLEEEKEKREEYLESIGDVTKQKDLGGFYRHLYEQKLGPDTKIEKCNEKGKMIPLPEIKLSEIEEKKKKDKDYESTDSSKKRNYRKRTSESKTQLSDGEIEESDEEINRTNLEEIRIAKRSKKTDENIDADSDFSIDESSDDEPSKTESKPLPTEDTFTKPATPNNKKEITTKNVDVIDEVKDKKVLTTESKQKIDIWKKRTVGEVFDQALKRYYERKASRGL